MTAVLVAAMVACGDDGSTASPDGSEGSDRSDRSPDAASSDETADAGTVGRSEGDGSTGRDAALPFDAGGSGDAGRDGGALDGGGWMPPDAGPRPPCGPVPDGALRYLDDTECIARLPSNRDRDLACPVRHGAAEGYRPATAPIVVDGDVLDGIVPADVRVTVILVRRLPDGTRYRYLSNGTHDRVVQPWSSTKFLAVANAAAHLRIRSDYAVGLSGRAGGIPLGDLVTVVHAYEESRYSSNALAAWFHDLGYRSRANDLVHDWLGRPGTERFGGNYGARSAALPYRITDGEAAVHITPDRSSGPANQLSTLSLAEALKRLVMHREDAGTRLPGIQWSDLRVLFYGAPESAWYDPDTRQGMQGDPSVYLAQALDLDALDVRSRGTWRLFGKLGFGPSRGFEIAHVGYACLPSLDRAGAPIPDAGHELVVASHLSARGDPTEGDARLATIYRELVDALVDGRIE